MTTPEIDTLVAVVTALVSWIGAAFIAGFRFGAVSMKLEALANRIDRVEKSQEALATKEQLAGLKEDVAEIKGMFRMTLKEPPP